MLPFKNLTGDPAKAHIADGISEELISTLSGLASIAGDALIHPDVFRAVAEYYGYRRDQPIPGPIGISTRLRPLDDGRVCAVGKKDGPCVLIFTQGPDTRWRLSGFAGDVSMLRLNR